MSRSGEGDEEPEEPRRPLLPPEDRLWRHPSEMVAFPVSDRTLEASSAASADPEPQTGARAPAGRSRAGGPRSEERRARARKATVLSLISGLMVGAAISAVVLSLTVDQAPRASRSTSLSDDATAAGTAGAPGAGGSIRADDAALGTVVAGSGASPLSTVMASMGPSLTLLDNQVGRSVVTVEVLRAGGEESGLGIELDRPGVVLTTDSLIDRAEAAYVTEPSGQTLMATTVGVDPVTDVGVLRVDAVGWAPMPVSDVPPQSQEVVTAVTSGSDLPAGRGPDIFMGEVTASSVSLDLPGRLPMLDGISTDVALPADADGAPLVDRAGRLVGMAAVTGTAGPTLAVPVETAMSAVDSLLATGSVPHGWIGVDQVRPTARGVLVQALDASGPAARAGIRIGEVLTAVDGTPVRTMDELRAEVQLRRPGTFVALEMWRAGAAWTVRVALGDLDGH